MGGSQQFSLPETAGPPDDEPAILLQNKPKPTNPNPTLSKPSRLAEVLISATELAVMASDVKKAVIPSRDSVVSRIWRMMTTLFTFGLATSMRSITSRGTGLSLRSKDERVCNLVSTGSHWNYMLDRQRSLTTNTLFQKKHECVVVLFRPIQTGEVCE